MSRTQVHLVCALVVVSVFSSLSLLKHLLHDSSQDRTIRSDSQQVIGELAWEVVDGESGAVISYQMRQIRACEVVVEESQVGTSDVTFAKRLDLDDGFFFIFVDHGYASREDVGAFGVEPGRAGYAFNWEYFVVTGESYASNRRNGGKVRLTPMQTDSGWEIGRIDVISDVSLRVDDDGSLIDFVRDTPRWRVRLKQGSHVNWPLIRNGEFHLDERAESGAPPN